MMIPCNKHKGFIEDCGCPDPSVGCLGFPQITAPIGTREREEQQAARNRAFNERLDAVVVRSRGCGL